ncbi:MAG TPA: ATP-binding protein [Candidatus Acidoferrales bacterium]|nr:ATP-binding protein [Candidatus Acidoferrales bacterium]
MSSPERKQRLWLVFVGVVVVLLAAAVFTLGSLGLPFEPGKSEDTGVVVLYGVSTVIVALLMAFGLVLIRMLVRLWNEKRAGQLGSRFKTKMVLGAMALSLLPVVFLFFISYALLNRSLSRWFPRSLEQATAAGTQIVNQFGTRDHERLAAYAQTAGIDLAAKPTDDELRSLLLRFEPGVDSLLFLDSGGHVAAVASDPSIQAGPPPAFSYTLPSGAELWSLGNGFAFGGRAPVPGGVVVALRKLPPDFASNYSTLRTEFDRYNKESQQYRLFKTYMLLSFSLFTLLLLFAVTWLALYLSKQVTVPIQALAEATREVSRGNFAYHVETQAQDELGTLVQSFNEMTGQLADSRRQIDEFTQSLQHAVQELERRRKVLEAVLENIPTGVISLDQEGNVVRVNSSASTMFQQTSASAHTLQQLVGTEAVAPIQALMRRSLRLGTASRALEIRIGGRVMHAAVTVSSLGPLRRNSGYVVVIDDLTDLLRAQKAAAWQEVAQRIAHEIKNPLTPIQLSAQRLERFLTRRAETAASAGAPDVPRDPDLEVLARECAIQIEREVSTMKSLVDEFSRFVRFPQARLGPADVNSVVSEALEFFRGRLDGISVRAELGPALPQIKADGELLRGVVVNLIDNAAEAMEGSRNRELTILTRNSHIGEMLEIVVCDTGRGISPEDKDKLFLPHFSTKNRGTGLGLAIASRVIAEHNGSIRVEDNLPTGSRFIICLPAMDVAAIPLASEV